MRLSRGHVAGAQTRRRVAEIHAAQVVAAPRVQAGVVQHGARRDGADDLPLHQPLGQGGILRLLADGHLVALGDEPGDVGIGGVVGDAAHGDLVLRRLGLVLVAGGQRQIQLLRGGAGVGAEHLVKIPQPEKQQGIRVLLLYVHILAHHGCQLCHGSGSFLTWG